VVLGLHPRASKPSARWRCAAGLGWCCPSATWRLVCPRPGPNSILGALPSPRPTLGHASECPGQRATWRLDCSQEKTGQAPRGAWTVCPQEKTQAPCVLTRLFS